MPKVLFTCALVGNLLIIYCAAASVTKTTPTTNDTSGVELERIMARREKLLEIIDALQKDPRSQNMATLIDNYGGIKQIATDMLTISLPEHLLPTNKPENFSLRKIPRNTKNPSYLDAAILINNYGGVQQMAMEFLSIFLQEHLLKTHKPARLSLVNEPKIKPKGETIFVPEELDYTMM